MSDSEIIDATSGDITATFSIDLDSHTWKTSNEQPEGAFPFVAEVNGKRYELYSDGTLNEEELPA